MEWPNQMVYEFLALYESEPTIWDSTSPNYKNRNEAHEAWIRIRDSFGDGSISITELKKKKESLMASYRRIKGKIHDTTNGTGSGDEAYKPEWPFFAIMDNFLGDIYNKPSVKAEVVPDSHEDTDRNELITLDDLRFDSNDTGQHIDSVKRKTAFKTPKNPKTMAKIKRTLEEIQNRMDESYTKQHRQRKDVSSLYCDLLTEKLRGLKEETRERAMFEIDKMIYNLKRKEKAQQENYDVNVTADKNQSGFLYVELETRNQDPLNQPQQTTKTSQENSNDSTSPLLAYFTRENDSARCDFCDVILPADSAVLKKHLRKKHPKLLVENASANENETEDTQNNEDIYTETTYLEEEDLAPTPKEKPKPTPKTAKTDSLKKRFTIADLQRKRLHSSSSSEDEVSAKKPKKTSVDEHEQEILKFGNYVTQLLKSLPKDVCTKLQMDIINLIMKVKLQAQKDSKLVSNVQNIPNNEAGNSAFVVMGNNRESSSLHSGAANITVPLAVTNNAPEQEIAYTITTLGNTNE